MKFGLQPSASRAIRRSAASGVSPKKQLTVYAGDKSFTVIARVDTPQEVEYIAHGGILQYVLRQRAAQMKQA